MNDTYCLAKSGEGLPRAIWIPSGSYRIYRGTPSQMVLEMVKTPEPLTVWQALESLTKGFQKSRNLVIQLPWKESDETLSALFVHALLELGISHAAPLA